MSLRRPGKREALENAMLELVRIGAPVEEIAEVQAELAEIESQVSRGDSSEELARVAQPDTGVSGAEQKTGGRDEVARAFSILRGVLAHAARARRPRFAVECSQLALGFLVGVEAASMREIARRHGVSVEAVSKAVVETRERFGLPEIEQRRSARAIEAARLSNVRHYA